MAFNYAKQEIKTKKMSLHLEIELNESSMTEEEATTRLAFLFNTGNIDALSKLIIFLLRETGSSTWDLKRLELNEIKEDVPSSDV